MISTVMRNAGLGIEQVGIPEIIHIRYKAGEVVDKERVMKAVQAMIQGLDDENSEFQITNPEVIEIKTIIS